MAGTLTIDTLKASSGVLATQNGMTGIAKAWVNWNGITTVTIRNSFNVSSVTRTSTGQYTVNLTTSMASANYATVISGSRTTTMTDSSTYNPTSFPTSASTISVVTFSDSTYLDYANVNVAVFGN